MAYRPARKLRFVVDPSLSRYAYRCYPDGCPRDRTCCVGLAIEVSRSEMRVIDSLMDELATLVPELREGDGYANVFDVDGEDVQIEPQDEDGTCPFLYRTERQALCAIHTLAVRSGREVPSVKPRACRHWPLVLRRTANEIRVTIHEDAAKIGCVAERSQLPDHPAMDEAFAEEIEELRRLVG